MEVSALPGLFKGMIGTLESAGEITGTECEIASEVVVKSRIKGLKEGDDLEE